MPETATIPASGKCRSSRHSSFSDAQRDMRLDAAAARGRVKTAKASPWSRQFKVQIIFYVFMEKPLYYETFCSCS